MSRLFPCLVICLLACKPVAADVHKCTDAQGNVSYRDAPCGYASSAIRRKSATAAAPDTDERMEKTQRLLRAFDAERQEEKQQQADARAEKAKRIRNCARAKDRLRQYETAAALYNIDQEGKRVYMTDTARTESIERARAEVANWCG